MNTLIIPEQKTPHFTFPTHSVTWKQDLTHLKQSLKKEDLEVFLDLFDWAAERPKKAKAKIEALRLKYPIHPEILNFCSFIYLRLRKVKKADQFVVENYQNNPDYLFARINYADLCLRRKAYEEIPSIFKGKFNLKDQYPEKKTFHVSAFRGFMVVMGLYHLAIGEREKAICYHYLAHRVDPKHPNTKILEKKIYYLPFYKKLINNILNIIKSPFLIDKSK